MQRHTTTGRIAGLLCLLLVASTTEAGGKVRADISTLKLPWYVAKQIRDFDRGSPRACARVHGTERKLRQVEIDTVVLESDLLKVTVLPNNGGAVARAVDKRTDHDLFFREGRVKDWLPYWESGLKASFPFREHGIGADQPTGWRIIERDDGSVTLAMWMEFSRYSQPYQRWIYGRYSSMMLSQLVTLRPGSSSFSVTYRIVNPVGYRQGRRLWMDAVFPRNHLPSGTVQGTSPPPRKSDSQFIFPVAWVSTHNGRDLRRWTQADSPVAAYDNTVSIFAWNRRYGVAGVWYPSVKVNRLMISDVDAAPGAKLWFAGEQQKPAEPWWNFKYNFVEIWGGSDSVFEGVEHWIAPGESYQFTQHFALAGGIGKVDFANDRAAVNVELAGDTPRVEAVLFQDAGNVSATWNGKPLGQGNAKVGEPMRFDLPADANAGRLVLKADDQAVVDERFPLRIPADREGHDEIKAALKSSPASLEKAGDNAHFGEMFRAAIGKYPAGSVGRGRLLYRDGYLQAAVRCLRKAVSDDPSVGEGWHLMGVALLEQDKKKQAATALNKALVAKRPCVHARYYLAVIALGEKDFDSADEHLATLIEKRKNHWEAKLLRVYTLKKRGEVKKARDLAYEMYSEDPADPRLIWLGRLELGSLFREGCVREPGAKRRIEEFSKAMKGELRPPARLGY